MNTVELLDKLFSQELQSELKEILVTCNKKGQYNVFGRYLVSPTKKGVYVVIDSHTKEVIYFESLKTAMSWCTLYNSQKWVAARRLHSLDLKLSSLNTDIAIHKRLLKNSLESEVKLTYLIKLQEDNFKRRQVIREINSFINSSKTIQETNIARIKDRKFKYK